jgi:hypothetical protein
MTMAGSPVPQWLDPACGSGTFLFHAICRKLAAVDAAGLTRAAAVAVCVQQVRGLDVHPVAVIIARVCEIPGYSRGAGNFFDCSL